MTSMKPRIRASQVDQFLACPASKTLQDLVPEDLDSPAALAGRWCHAQAARLLMEQESAAGPSHLVMPEFKTSGFHQWMVNFYLGAVRMYVEPYMALEVEGAMEWEFERFILTGHFDCLGIDPEAREAVGFDLKAGDDPVMDSDDNPQMLAYRVLLALNYPDLQTLRYLVVQPSGDPDAGYEQITGADATEGREKLEQMAAYLEAEINRALNRGRLLNSDGWRQCRYCKAALGCPCLKKEIENMQMELTNEMVTRFQQAADIEGLYKYVEASRKTGPLFDRATAVLREEVAKMGGAELSDGTKLLVVERAGRRFITNNAAAAAKLADLPDDLYDRCYAFRPPEIERVLAEHLRVPMKAKKGPDARKEYDSRLGDLTKQDMHRLLKISA